MFKTYIGASKSKYNFEVPKEVWLAHQKRQFNKSCFNSYLGIVIGLFFLIVYYLFSIESSVLFFNPNLIGPIYFGSLLAFYALKFLLKSPKAVWTPAFTYLVGSAIFFGIGPLVYVLGNDNTISSLQLNPISKVTPDELLRTNLLSTVGTFFVSLTILLFCRKKAITTKITKQLKSRYKSNTSLLSLGLFLIGFGFFINFFIILPFNFGQTIFAIPGVFSVLYHCVNMGNLVLSYTICKNKNRPEGKGIVKLVLFASFILGLVLTFLELDKFNLMIFMLSPALGAYLGNFKIKPLIATVLLIFIIYNIYQPFVLCGRNVITQKNGAYNIASFGERWAIIINIIDGTTGCKSQSQIGSADAQEGWTRLAYSGAQARVMNLYDSGSRYNTTVFDYFSPFVPRFLWPDKPIIAKGRAFYEMLTGHDRATSVGPTLYGDAYWNGGWLMVIINSMIIGLLFTITTHLSFHWILTDDLIYLPVIYISAITALNGFGGFFVSHIIAVIPIYVAYITVIYILRNLKPT